MVAIQPDFSSTQQGGSATLNSNVPASYNLAASQGNVFGPVNPSSQFQQPTGGTSPNVIPSNTIQDYINNASASTNTGNTTNNNLTTPINQAIQYNPADFQVPDINKFFNDAYNALAPYYTQLLTEANGDYNTA